MALQLEESVGNPARPDRAPRLYMGKAGYFYRGIVEIECLFIPFAKPWEVWRATLRRSLESSAVVHPRPQWVGG